MGRRVFNLEGSDEEVANKAIDAIVDFYEKDMKVPTHISAYDPTGDRKWVDEVEKKQDEIEIDLDVDSWKVILIWVSQEMLMLMWLVN